MPPTAGPPGAWGGPESNRSDPPGEADSAREDASDEDASDLSASDAEETTWISWFCSLKGNEFFVEVDEDFIQDDFNLTSLSSQARTPPHRRPHAHSARPRGCRQVPYYEYALDTILDVETPRDAGLTEEQQDSIEAAAELLYGLIHARYIITPRGMNAMVEKFENMHFGRCPRVLCQGQPVLPVGQSDLPRTHTCKTFCPKCEDIYYPRSSRHANLDGAYFGTTFCHLFLQTYWDLVPPPPTTTYVPRIFGFKIHRTARARLAAAAGRPAVTSNSAAAAPAAPGRRATATAPARTAK